MASEHIYLGGMHPYQTEELRKRTNVPHPSLQLTGLWKVSNGTCFSINYYAQHLIPNPHGHENSFDDKTLRCGVRDSYKPIAYPSTPHWLQQ